MWWFLLQVGRSSWDLGVLPRPYVEGLASILTLLKCRGQWEV